MKAKIFKSFFIGCILFWVQSFQAQNPNWSVNVADFQYSMTFTSFLNVNGINLISVNDKVAAFVDGEIRGVANVKYVASANKYVAFLSVYANTNKENIDFKIYDSKTNSVVDIDKKVEFIIDGNLGGIFQSYSIANPELSENAIFSAFNFLGITAVTKEILENAIHLVLPENTDVNSLVPVFSSSVNSKVFVDTVLQISGSSAQNFTNAIIYKVLSENEAILKSYEVTVSLAVKKNPITVTVATLENLTTNSNPISLDIAFSKKVSGFDISDFSLANAVVSFFSTSDFQNYKIEVVPISQGDFSVQIPANISLDLENNQNNISNKIELHYDISEPIINAVSVDSDTNSWWFLVGFNESVLNVDITDFELKGMASDGLVISSTTKISDKQYKVNISNTNNIAGTISLQLKKSSDIKDLAGNLAILNEFEAYFLTKKVITITADAKTKVYGEADPELTYIITSGSLVSGDVLSGSLTRVAGEQVGDYLISSTLSNDDYTINYIPNNLSITKKAITITADAKTKVYGEVDPQLTYKITSGNLVNGDGLSGNLTRVAGEDVGDYLISSSLSNDNYSINFSVNNLSITKKIITITADAKTKAFGEVDPELTYRITSGSLIGGDILSGNLTRVTGEDVGEYLISSSLSNDNYSINYFPNNLSITSISDSTKKAVTITADAKTKVYGEVDPELTYRITSGSLISGDFLSGSLIRVVGEDVGEYLISSTLSNNEYSINYFANNLSITKKAITITADAKTKAYGEADPELTYIITSGSLLPGDVLSGSLSRVAGEQVGDYLISSSLLNNNYIINYVPNNLSITKKAITITADSKTKVY
jgi:uncharacterized RmlC-like cupin family protein